MILLTRNAVSLISILMILLIPMSGYCDTESSQNGDTETSSTISDIIKDTKDNLPLGNATVKSEEESYYEVQFISPEFLTHLIANADPEDEILKAGPGMTIGLYTPQVLYVRGDLAGDDFLIELRNKANYKDKITQHLIDIAFGSDNANLSLLQSDLPYQFWFDSSYTQHDIDMVLSFAKMFNNLSETTEFEDESVMRGDLKDNYQEIPYHYYNIKLVPMKYLNEYKEDKYQSSREELIKDSNGKMIGFMTADYLYLWDDLKPAEKDYYLKKCLLWSCGLHGLSTTDPDSFFSSKPNISADFSDLDKEAMKLLYGGRLNNNMKPDMVKKALDISE